MNDHNDPHLLSGAVGKRKVRFSGLFGEKPSDYAHHETPGASGVALA
jgi:hypothetical protein